MISVDIDEADVAVLSQNLTRSKDLFASIGVLLRNISQKTLTASRNIKPVFAEINALNAQKDGIDEGLELLKDVADYSLKAAGAQKTLSSPIDSVGVPRYLQCLEESVELLKGMKKDIRDFDGIVVTFANAVDKAEMNVFSYFSKLLTQFDPSRGQTPNVSDAKDILSFFGLMGKLRTAHETIEKVFGGILLKKVGPLEASCALQPRKANTPYEKGVSGLSEYTKLFASDLESVRRACEQLEVLGSPILHNIIVKYMETRFVKVIQGYNTFIGQNGLAGQDLVLLEIFENLQAIRNTLAGFNIAFESLPLFNEAYIEFVDKSQGLLYDWVRYVESRVLQIEKFNEHSMPEVVVEVLSKIRRIADFDSLSDLMQGKQLGGWLDVKPPPRSISVFTSVVAGAEAQTENEMAFLVSSFLLDLIDELMINLEISLKEQQDSFRKLTQGFMLVKNLVMIETIVNRLENLYHKLGSIGMERLLRLKNRFLKLFLDDWNYASYIIIRDMTQITTTNAMHGGSSSTKEKEQIKELFRNFNEAFDEALRQYERFNIQERDLRTYLLSEIKKLIVNAYNKLYDKYGSGDFTKNRSKYVKYDKMQFERALNERL